MFCFAKGLVCGGFLRIRTLTLLLVGSSSVTECRLTPDGPSVLEFNCRFGDPETQVVLPLLETDLYETMAACCTGTLDTVDVRFKENISAATVVCAAKGYPEKYPKGMEIKGLDEAKEMENIKVAIQFLN